MAVNSLNRSMGQPDLYPFALTPGTIEKLRFIHELVQGGREAAPQRREGARSRVSQTAPAIEARTSATGSDSDDGPDRVPGEGDAARLQAGDEVLVVLGPVVRDEPAERAGR